MSNPYFRRTSGSGGGGEHYINTPEADLVKLVRFSLGVAFGDCQLFRKFHADQFTESGVGDLVGHILGKYVELELKVSKNYFSGVQKANLARVQASGGAAFGLLHHRESKSYYLLPVAAVTEFSYHDVAKWLPLPVIDVPGREGSRPALNLQALRILIA